MSDKESTPNKIFKADTSKDGEPKRIREEGCGDGDVS